MHARPDTALVDALSPVVILTNTRPVTVPYRLLSGSQFPGKPSANLTVNDLVGSLFPFPVPSPVVVEALPHVTAVTAPLPFYI